MAYCIRKKKVEKKHKGKAYHYTYFELVKTYRDPQNKSRVISKFVRHLGKDKEKVRENLKAFKRHGLGQYALNELMKEMERVVE